MEYVCRFVFFQAEDGIRDLVRSRGLGDVYKRQQYHRTQCWHGRLAQRQETQPTQQTCLDHGSGKHSGGRRGRCLLYTSDAADERSSVDLGGRRIIKKKKP